MLKRTADNATRTLHRQAALYKSYKSGKLETLRLLLEKGADTEVQDGWGWWPLHTASAADFRDILELMIANNAELQARDKDSRSVQACAAMAGNHGLFEILRRARLDAPLVDSQDLR